MHPKVLFVIDGLRPGGAERSLAEMLPGLAQEQVQSIVAFFHQHDESLEGLFRAQGTDLRVLSQPGIWQRVVALRRLIQTERPDVVHTTLFEADVIGRIAAIGLKTVVVTSLVNTSYDPIRLQNSDVSPFKLSAARVIDAWTARWLTTHFHAVSEPVKIAAVEALGLSPERISVIERGRDGRFGGTSDERRASARQKLGLTSSDEVILTVGRQEYQKGHRFLIEAMQEVTRLRPRALLLVAGSRGRHTPIVEHLIEQNRNVRVRLLGHRDDVPDLLAAADVFAFPSLYEGAAGALLEAMAMGLPIVASRIPAIESVVEENRNALIVDRASVGPLARAIADLLADRDAARAFGLRSREIFEARFTLERSAARMVEFYRRLTTRAASPFQGAEPSELHCK